MLKGVLCSTGAIITRRNGRDVRLAAEFAPHIECDGFELMLYPSWYEDGRLESYIEFLSGSGLYFPVLHADKSIGELFSVGGEENRAEALRRFGLNCAAAERVGSGLMVLHLWGGPASDYNIERNIAELDGMQRYAAARGIVLTVENVICALGSPLEHLMRIAETVPGAKFTIDTKMAQFHRELEATAGCGALFGGGLAAHLHVNDYAGGYKDFTDLRVMHIGEGGVDFAPFCEAVRACGYDGFATVEATSVFEDGSIDHERLNRSLNAVRKMLE